MSRGRGGVDGIAKRGARRSGAKKPQDWPWHRRPGDLASARRLQGRRRLWVAAGGVCPPLDGFPSRPFFDLPPPPPALPWPWPWPCGAGQPCEHANAIAQSGPRFPMGPRGIWGAAIVVTPPRIGVSLRLAALPPCRRRLASSRGIPTQGRTWASSRRDRSSMKRHSGG